MPVNWGCAVNLLPELEAEQKWLQLILCSGQSLFTIRLAQEHFLTGQFANVLNERTTVEAFGCKIHF